jgi:hypothetical protein
MRRRFVIDGLPRTGSTAIARILPLAGISCLVEPFHPRRYNGRYYNSVSDIESLRSVLNLLWLRWNGLKHIWVAPEGFPFDKQPWLNDELVRCADTVIFLRRRNYFQRYVSTVLSRSLGFWIGEQQEYRHRLDQNGIPDISPETVIRAIEVDRKAVERREEFLIEMHVAFLNVYYEDIFGEGVSTSEQINQINRILTFVGYATIDEEVSRLPRWQSIMNLGECKWNTKEIYSRIPGVSALEAAVGSDENGWLFRC